MTALEPQFDELNIDPSVRYLYGILPYVDTDAAGNTYFMRDSVFMDFRDPYQVEDSRDPFNVSPPSDGDFNAKDGPYMHPWYTPLTQLENNGRVIIYDARRHLIWIIDQEGWWTTDLALRDIEPKDGETSNQNSFEHIPSRPAGEVLKEIVQWYRNLYIVPGGGEYSLQEWDHYKVPLRDLYIANGWPDRFDADAFEVSQARAFSRSVAQDFADRPLSEVARLEEVIERNKHWIETQTAILGWSTTKEGEWAARSRIRSTEIAVAKFEEDLIVAQQKAEQECPENVCLPPQEWPLWELQAVTETVERLKTDIAFAESQIKLEPFEGQDLDEWQEYVQRWKNKNHLMKRKLAVYQKAYEAAREDVERLCPGQTFESVTGLTEMGWFVRTKEDIRRILVHKQNELELTRQWYAQLPHDVPDTRSKIEKDIQSLEEGMQFWEEILSE